MAKGDGEKIAIRFTESIIGDPSGNESKFDISFQEPTFVPGGILQTVHREVVSVSKDESDDKVTYLHFASGNQNSIQNAVGDITVAYSGGTLMGDGGSVVDFEESFTPEDLDFKVNQNDAEHIELQSVTISGILTEIEYIDAAEMEHIEIASVTAQGILTHINDL